jgi:hypothetical protein
MQENFYYHIFRNMNGEYGVNACKDKKILENLRESEEDKGQRVIYEGKLTSGIMFRSLLITNFLNEINEKGEIFDKDKLEEILTKENKNGFR